MTIREVRIASGGKEMIYKLNIGGQSCDEFEADDDEDALEKAEALLAKGPWGEDPDTFQPAVKIYAGVFDESDTFIGEVSYFADASL